MEPSPTEHRSPSQSSGARNGRVHRAHVVHICKWIATYGCFLMLILYATTFWWSVSYVTRSTPRTSVGVENGGAWTYRVAASERAPRRLQAGWRIRPATPAKAADYLWPARFVERGRFGVKRWLPLWIPASIVLAPTLLLWRVDRRQLQHGRCPECGYDLTGNVSGTCPECGTARNTPRDWNVLS